MFTIIFYGLVILAIMTMILTTIVGITIGKSILLWLAGMMWYVASFLGSMSIGLYLLIFPFTLWMLAFAHTFRLVKKPSNTGLFLVTGILLWIVSISIVDDYWLFYPFSLLL